MMLQTDFRKDELLKFARSLKMAAQMEDLCGYGVPAGKQGE